MPVNGNIVGDQGDFCPISSGNRPSPVPKGRVTAGAGATRPGRKAADGIHGNRLDDVISVPNGLIM